MELLKWFNANNRKNLLRLINKWWNDKKVPEEICKARVVSIYKKGDPDEAANYRPISLLSSFYKIYMILIRTRIQEAVESKLTNTQYGFRPGRSTSHAIYTIRRLQDYAEKRGSKLCIALLDWEKAFDKILLTVTSA